MSLNHFLYNKTFPVLVVRVSDNLSKYKTVYKKVKFNWTSTVFYIFSVLFSRDELS